MLKMDEIIEHLGRDEYRIACAASRKFAPGTGTSLGKNDFDSNIPHEISDLVWDSQCGSSDKLEMIFKFYEGMPCYAYLMYVSMHFMEFSAETKSMLWSKYKHFLSGEDALADPVAYSLWCDFFEDQERVGETWKCLTEDTSDKLPLQRILVSSGPVPYSEKEKLFQQLIPYPDWHYYIFRSLLHSQFDIYGNTDRVKARKLLRNLHLLSDTENLATLKDALR